MSPLKVLAIGAAGGLLAGVVIMTINKPKQLPAMASRPSCKECVTKHLGSAAVLMGEINDGYPEHRLFAIGNMREAEEESQAWPELHNAIRAARRDYTQQGTIPDWRKLEALVAQAGSHPT